MRKKTSIIWAISDEEFQELLDTHNSVVSILKHLKLSWRTGNRRTFKARLQSKNYNLDKFNESSRQLKKRANGGGLKKKPDELVFTECSSYHGRSLKKRIIQGNMLPYECFECGNMGEHNDKPLMLQLDHINGINNDNRIENLRFLCPNCHSQTETFSGKHRKIVNKCECGQQITKKSKYCMECFHKNHNKPQYKIEWPDVETMRELVAQQPTTKIAKQLGVSDVAVSNFCKKHGINKPGRGDWAKRKGSPPIL